MSQATFGQHDSAQGRRGVRGPGKRERRSASRQGDDDTWDLVVKCNNLDSSSSPIFPLGYHFDYDDTTVSIT